jgi:hypothetical protein
LDSLKKTPCTRPNIGHNEVTMIDRIENDDDETTLVIPRDQLAPRQLFGGVSVLTGYTITVLEFDSRAIKKFDDNGKGGR